jgi:HAE1 family hydrophobic/amphiphilic exporter-1
LAVSQVLTLFTTPVVYLYLDQFSNWLSGWGRGDAGSDRNVPGGAAINEAAE